MTNDSIDLGSIVEKKNVCNCILHRLLGFILWHRSWSIFRSADCQNNLTKTLLVGRAFCLPLVYRGRARRPSHKMFILLLLELQFYLVFVRAIAFLSQVNLAFPDRCHNLDRVLSLSTFCCRRWKR
jgi:hypothetical protein